MLRKRKNRPAPRRTNPVEPRHLRRLLSNSLDHYSSVFHGRFGWIFNHLFDFLFGDAMLSEPDREEIRRAARLGAVCYVVRSPSRLEYLRLSFILRREGLPYPQFAHYMSVFLWQPVTTFVRRGIGMFVSLAERQGYPNPYRNGYVDQLVERRVPMLLPLLQFGGLPRRFGKERIDPLQELMRIRRESDARIIAVPLVLIYGRRPDRETRSMLDMIIGPADAPGRVRRLWMALRNRKATTIKVAQPRDLEDLEDAVEMKVPSLAEPEREKAYHIRKTLLDHLETERRVVVGPARKTRAEIVEQVLHDQDFVARLMQYCKANDKPFIETRRRARRYLEEMAADLRPGAVWFFRTILDRMLPRIYDSVEVDAKGLEHVRRVMRQMPVVFVPSHKSHIDYLILNYVLDLHHVSLPITVSGMNLNFWPIGSLFRSAGALFMRRSFRGKRIYTLCLVKYIETVLREGIALTFFVEGGRSRIGKLLPPKTGFAQYLMEAAARLERKDIAFVPVSISYERIFEESFYTNEAAGKPNEGENLGTVLRHRRMLSKSRGRVWIDFAQPVNLADVIWEVRPDARLTDVDDRRALASEIAHRAVYRINRLQPITPYGIVAEALLAGTRRGIPLENVQRRCDMLIDYLREKGAPLTEQQLSVETILATMVAEKRLTIEKDDDDDQPQFYYLDEDNRLPLTIYANTVVPHHQTMSLLAMALRGTDDPVGPDKLLADFEFLVDLLKREFVFGPTPMPNPAARHAAFDRGLGWFEGQGWIAKHADGYLPTGDGRFAAETFAAAVAGYVESYHLAARGLLTRKSESFTDKEIIKFILKKGHRLVSMGELDHPEAVHKIIIETALRHFADSGLLRSETDAADKTKIAGRTYQVADYVRLREILDRTAALLATTR